MKRTMAVAVLIFVSVFSGHAFSWDDGVTHKDLSEYAAINSILDKSKGDYLNGLGFPDGLYTWLKWNGNRTIKDGYIIEWLREGAMLEDSSGPLFIGYIDGKGRSFNHFHNPLKPWAQAGLDDFFTGESSLLWAQDENNQENFYEGNWS